MTTSTSEDAKGRIRARALKSGFSVCGFASASDPWPAGARLAEFVAAGRHGDMTWMAETEARRASPQAQRDLLPLRDKGLSRRASLVPP